MSKSTIIAESEGYRLVSHFHGEAYTLDNKATGRAIFAQGDDATLLRAEYEKLCDSRPIVDALHALWWNWNT